MGGFSVLGAGGVSGSPPLSSLFSWEAHLAGLRPPPADNY